MMKKAFNVLKLIILAVPLTATAAWDAIVTSTDDSGWQSVELHWVIDAGNGWKYFPAIQDWAYLDTDNTSWSGLVQWQDDTGWQWVDIEQVYDLDGGEWKFVPDLSKWIYLPGEVIHRPPVGFSFISAGWFEMGDVYWNLVDTELPVHSVYVSPYYIHRTEVTNAQMAAVLNWAIESGLAEIVDEMVYNLEGDQQALFHLHSRYCELTWNGSMLEVIGKRDAYPCTELTWYGAMAYCHYLTRMEGVFTQAVDLSDWSMDMIATGYRLPTEAEWEKAARGGQIGRLFPWVGNSISHDQANYFSARNYNYDVSPTRGLHPSWETGNEPHTSPAGSFEANEYGLYDLAGNLYEWCWDWYSPGYYSESPDTNPQGPTEGDGRVIRGGYWKSGAPACRVSDRANNDPRGFGYYSMGFRPVRSSP